MGFHGFESFQKNLENSEVAMPIAVELLTLEVLHRIIVCAYEVSTYFMFWNVSKLYSFKEVSNVI